VIITFIVGLMLTVMPLPESAEPFRPDWLALVVIFWAMQLPRTWSVGSAWFIGIVLDVSYGTLLGQHALALCLVAFATVRFHLLMRVFPFASTCSCVSSRCHNCQPRFLPCSPCTSSYCSGSTASLV
jgi:rod shape-determining protein MreD